MRFLLLPTLLSCGGGTGTTTKEPVPATDFCHASGTASARVLTPYEHIPGETAVASAGDLILVNDHAAFVITEPDKGSTYYHYGGIVADAVAMDGCTIAGEDKLDEIGVVLAEIDLANFTSSVLRAFRGTSVEIINDGSNGEAAHVRVTGTDDTYWVVEYTLIAEAIDEGGRAPSGPFGVDLVIDYTLAPDSPVLKAELSVTNTGDEPRSLVAANLLSFAGPMDLFGYAPYEISTMGVSLDYGMPWLVASDDVDAIAFGIEDGSLAYMGISGIQVALDVSQALSDPIEVAPGETDSRTFFLSVGSGGGTSATAPLALANPEPLPGVSYTLGMATGRVVDPAGEGVGQARLSIEARAEGADWGVLDVALTGADGSFSVPLPVFSTPWEWRLTASADGRHDSDPVEVGTDEQDVTLEISDVGTLAYAITDGEGASSPARLALDAEDGTRLDLWLAGEGTAPVPPGTYAYTATRGYEYAPVTGTLTVPEGGTAALELSMDHVVDTRGYVSIDTHVHSWDSPDSRVDPADMLLHAAAHGLDIVVHTEHENIVDRTLLPVTTGLGGHVGSITGEEVTATLPEHLTMFPSESDGTPRGGFVQWYGLGLDEIFGLMRERSGGGVNLLNHPSYLDKIGWDRLLAEPTLTDPTLLGLSPDASIWSWDFDGMEVMNGHSSPFDSGNGRWNNWQSMLNAGHPIVPVGCSDDHGGTKVGFPRSYLPASSDLAAEVSDQEVVDAFRGGQIVASAGAFATVWLNGEAGPGDTLDDGDGAVDLDVHIEAIPEIDVRFVSVFVNCDEVLTVAASDPSGVVKLSDTLTVDITEDSHITVAAFGEDLLPAGLPQYDPTHVPRVLTGAIYVDFDGNGVFDAPGGRECAVYLTGPDQ